MGGSSLRQNVNKDVISSAQCGSPPSAHRTDRQNTSILHKPKSPCRCLRNPHHHFSFTLVTLFLFTTFALEQSLRLENGDSKNLQNVSDSSTTQKQDENLFAFTLHQTFENYTCSYGQIRRLNLHLLCQRSDRKLYV